MHAATQRKVLAVAGAAMALFKCAAALAAKAPSPPRAFREWVEQWATDHKATLFDWWSAELDGDSDADAVALICGGGEGDEQGFYLVESGKGERSVVRFGADGRSERCPNTGADVPEPSGPPPFRSTSDHSIVHRQGLHHGAEETHLALRDGQLITTRVAERSIDPPRCDDEGHCSDGRSGSWVLDWEKLVQHQERSALSRDPHSGAESARHRRVRDEAVLLVTAPSAHPPTWNTRVRGRSQWKGPADASFAVAVTQPDRDHLAVRISLTDDQPVAAAARTAEALGAADHLEAWIGDRSVRLARIAADNDNGGKGGGGWFALPGANLKPSSMAEVTTTGDATSVEITVPLAWARWEAGLLAGCWSSDECPPPSAQPVLPPAANDEIFTGSLVVAFADVDAAGAPARSVVSTAPLPRQGAPRGLLLKLPRAARWSGSSGLFLGPEPVALPAKTATALGSLAP